MKDLFKILLFNNPNKFLKSKGVSIGERVKLIIYPYIWSLPLIGSEPWLIKIDDDTLISFDVTFLTHDGGLSVIKKNPKYKGKYKNVVKFCSIEIGKNCFIGCHTTIMPNVTIGDNSIVGAGSVVTKSIPSGEVWAGVPAKFICSLDDFVDKTLKLSPDCDFENLKNNYRDETTKIALKYKK